MTAPVAITLLTQPNCAFCDHAKQVLHHVSTDYALHITEIDLATNGGRALAQKAGVLFAPGVLIDGEPFCFGRLSERKLRRTLRKRNRTLPSDGPSPTGSSEPSESTRNQGNRKQ
ncbi:MULTISPECIES: glutaredoxin family protein [Nocardia]|uniref:glutaredoxin family protein n=1 Tax=Nocardia TaxID=1817 RepID=UPI0002FDF45C|nr:MULTISPECIES: glutaredoxin family protein [Nocardia]